MSYMKASYLLSNGKKSEKMKKCVQGHKSGLDLCNVVKHFV
jgi:hypothetical protein